MGVAGAGIFKRLNPVYTDNSYFVKHLQKIAGFAIN